MGEPPEGDWEPYVHYTLAGLAVLAFLYQVIYLQKMTILPVYIIPIASLCIAYVNIALALGTRIGKDGAVAYISYICMSLTIPILLTTIVELSYRLFETRSAQFFCIRFDEAEGEEYSPTGATSYLVGMRILSLGLLAINILVYFEFIPGDNTIYGGYIALEQNPSNLHLWLSLVPPMVLSFFSILVSIAVIRYVQKRLTVKLKINSNDVNVNSLYILSLITHC